MKPHYFAYAILSALLIAGSAEARSYNCADPASRADGRWPLDEGLSHQVIADIQSQHLGKPKHLTYRFCGTVVNGEQVIMVGTLEIVDGKPVCDSAANFAVFYDPRKRTFGDIIPGVNMCMPSAPGAAPNPAPSAVASPAPGAAPNAAP